jgi:methionine-S-sulfoxide reductase
MAFVRRLLNSGSRSKKADPAVNGAVSGGSNKMSSEEEAAVGQMAGLSLADGGDREVATFAMSWFWFPEAQFGSAPGVLQTRVGFTGGKKKGPSYYSLGDHTESVEIVFDPRQTEYRTMLKMFWDNHDATRCASRQYMSAIFYHGEEQKKLAEESMKERQKQLSKPIATKIHTAETFYEAEK